MANTPEPPTSAPGDLSKEELEREKLGLEIAELRRWWRRPAYVQSVLSVLVASIAAIATLLMGYVNGWFDAQRARLEIQRADIRRDIEVLSAGRSELHAQISFYAQQVRGLRSQLDEIRKQARTYETRLTEQSHQNKTCLADVARWVARFDEIDKKQYARKGGIDDRVSELLRRRDAGEQLSDSEERLMVELGLDARPNPRQK